MRVSVIESMCVWCVLEGVSVRVCAYVCAMWVCAFVCV